MTLTSLERVITNRMAIVNKHDYDGFDEVYTHNKQKFKNYRIKKRRKYNMFFFNLLYFTI